MVLTVSFVLSSATNSFLSPSPTDLDLSKLGWADASPLAWHQQRMPGPHDFAVRSDLNQRFGQPCAASQNFGQGVEAPFVCAPVDRSQDKPALRLHLRANAAASTASHPAFVTTAKRPSCRERTGRAGRTDLPDGESEIFFAGELDRILLICPSRLGKNSAFSRVDVRFGS